jgi:hypothetical protein
MKNMVLGIALAGSVILSSCSTVDLEAFSQGLAEAQYNAPYTYGNAYNPYGTRTSYGQWVGYNQCSHAGDLYTCDTDGNGYADMFGDASDGSYTSTSLKVNGKGEGFTRNTDTGEWERNRAYDTSDRDDHLRHRRRHDRGYD